MVLVDSVKTLLDEDGCARVLVSFTCDSEPVAGTSVRSASTATGSAAQPQRGPAAGPSLLWLLGMGATEEELEREQSVGNGMNNTVEATCAVISLPLGTGYLHILLP